MASTFQVNGEFMSDPFICPDNLPRQRRQRMRRAPHRPLTDLERQQLTALANAISGMFRRHGVSEKMTSHADAILNFARTAPRDHQPRSRAAMETAQ